MAQLHFKEIMNQLSGRGQDTLSPNLLPWSSLEESQKQRLTSLIFTSSSDVGVYRNGGRRGAEFGPTAILAVLKKMAKHNPQSFMGLLESADKEKEKLDFTQGQEREAEVMASTLGQFVGPSIFHLGGGHDHIYPLLCALELNGHRKITVINLDAHLDTRMDALPHSGTPFRQFSQKTKGDFELIQIGIHPFSNAPTNYTPLTKGKMKILNLKSLQENCLGYSLVSLDSFFKKHITMDSQRTFVLSLDADALSSSFMEGVSAVNPSGLSLDLVSLIFHWYSISTLCSKKIYGLYEFNPLFDNLSQKGAKALAFLLYQTLFSLQPS